MGQNLSLVAVMGDDPDVKRDVVIRLLVNQAERDAMQAAADADGVTLSEWIRRRCIKTTTTVEVAVVEALGRAAERERAKVTAARAGLRKLLPKKGGR